MTTYNTRNAVPSADALDRYDNSQVFDELMNGQAPQTPDRLGVLRQSWAGMQADFSAFLLASGFESTHLTYVAGTPLVVNRPTQLIDYNGSVYRAKTPATFPVGLSGTWANDSAKLVDVGDMSLRQALAALTGAGLVKTSTGETVEQAIVSLRSQTLDSVAAMRALTAAVPSVVVRDYRGGFAARANPVPRGGDVFDWNATSTVADNGIDIFKLTNVATGRYIRRRGTRPVDPFDGGAAGDGTTDDFTPAQNTLTWAESGQASCGANYWTPAADFYIGQGLNQTRQLKWSGAGRGLGRFILNGGSGLTVTPPTGRAASRFWTWDNFSLVPKTAGTGDFGMRIKLNTGCFLSNYSISYIEVGDILGRGLEFDNSVKNLDGFFTGVVERCWINSGIHGTNMGDSLTFQHNTITGRNCGIEITGLQGARQMIIHDNNVTTSGGALALLGVEQPQITNNQFEHPGYSSGYTGIYDSFIYLSGCFKATLEGNTINPDNRSGAFANAALPSSTITMDNGTRRTVLKANDVQKARLYHINNGVTGVSAYVDKYNTTYGDVAWANSGTVIIEAQV